MSRTTASAEQSCRTIATPPRRMPKWGWYAFLFFSFLSAASAFKFVPPGLIQGFFPSLGDGLPAAWTAFVNEGIRRGADHVAHHIANVGNTLAVHMIFGGLSVLLIPLAGQPHVAAG
jgi:hypothetical protein